MRCAVPGDLEGLFNLSKPLQLLLQVVDEVRCLATLPGLGNPVTLTAILEPLKNLSGRCKQTNAEIDLTLNPKP
jgi:hypothetical protein